MTWKPSQEEDERQAGLLPWTGRQLALTPTSEPARRERTWRKRFGHFLSGLYYGLKGYAWEDINRLKEAGVQQVEAKAAKDFAERDERLANAAKAHAEAEAIRMKSACDTLKTQVEAVERIQAVISRIKQSGGAVAFDEKELQNLVMALSEKFPHDQKLLDARKDIESGQS